MKRGRRYKRGMALLMILCCLTPFAPAKGAGASEGVPLAWQMEGGAGLQSADGSPKSGQALSAASNRESQFILDVSNNTTVGEGEQTRLGETMESLIDRVFGWGEWVGFLLFLALPVAVIVILVKLLGRKRGGGEQIYRMCRAKHVPACQKEPPSALSPAQVTQLLRTVGGLKKKQCPQYAATLLDLCRKGQIQLQYASGQLTITLPREIPQETWTAPEVALMHVVASEAEQGAVDINMLSQSIRMRKAALWERFQAFDAAVNASLEQAGLAVRGPYSLLYRKLTGKLSGGLFAILFFVLCTAAVIFLYLSIRGILSFGWAIALVLAVAVFLLGRSRESHLYLTEAGEQEAALWLAFAQYLKTPGEEMDQNPETIQTYLCYAAAIDWGKSFYETVRQAAPDAWTKGCFAPMFVNAPDGKPVFALLDQFEAATAAVIHCGENTGAPAQDVDSAGKTAGVN